MLLSLAGLGCWQTIQHRLDLIASFLAENLALRLGNVVLRLAVRLPLVITQSINLFV